MSKRKYLRTLSFFMACLMILSSFNMPVFASETEFKDVSDAEAVVVSEEPQTEEEADVSEEPQTEEEADVSEESQTEEEVDVSEESQKEEEVAVSEEPQTEEEVAVSEEPQTEEEVGNSEEPQTEEEEFSYDESEEEIFDDILEGDFNESLLSGPADFEFKYMIIDDNAIITGYEGTITPTDIFIFPDSIDGHTVTEIRERAFANCTALTGEVRFGKYMNKIGKRAFLNCTGITRFTFASGLADEPYKGVTIIGDYAFQNCTGVKEIIFANSITSMGTGVISGCTGLVLVMNESELAINLDKTLLEGSYWTDKDYGMIIEDEVPALTYAVKVAFDYSVLSAKENTAEVTGFRSVGSKLRKLIIPSTIDGYTITKIGEKAFSKEKENMCTLTGEVVIPETVKIIGGNAFNGQSELTGSLIIPDSVTAIGDYAFNKCGISGELVVPRSVISIGTCAFSECNSINNLTLENGLESIGACAFGMTAISKLVIPETVTEIGGMAFANNMNLKGRVVIPEGLFVFGDSPFLDTDISILENRTSVRLSYTGLGLNEEEVWKDYATGESLHKNSRGIYIEPGQIAIREDADQNIFAYSMIDGSETEICITKYVGDVEGDLYIPAKYKGYTIARISEDVFENLTKTTKIINMSAAQVTLPVVEGHYWTLTETGSRYVTILSTGETAVRDDYEGRGLHYEGLKLEAYDYTGSAIKPKITVYDGKKLLKEKTDYSITYKNNTKVYKYRENEEGFAASKAPSITITGKGSYFDKRTLYFTIGEKSLEDSDINIAEISSAIAGEKAYKPAPKVTYGKKTLKKGTDYTIKYFNSSDAEVTPKENGSYTAVISGIGSYTGTVRRFFYISPSTTRPVSKLTVSLDKKSYEYNDGKPIEPIVTIKDGKTILDNDWFIIMYENNTQVGKGTVEISYKLSDEKYTGLKEITFNITGQSISKYTVKGIKTNLIYSGEEMTQGINSDLSEVVLGSTPVKWIVKSTYDELSDESKLTYGAVVTYENSINAGTATMTFTGVNGYTGTKKVTYKINPYTIMDTGDSAFKFELPYNSYTYNSAGVNPEPIVTFGGKALSMGKDYTVSYANNTKVAGENASKKPTVKVKGKGNYSGTITRTFVITSADLHDIVKDIIVCGKAYTNKPGNWKSEPIVYDVTGKKLKAGKDYVVKYFYSSIPEGETVRDGSKKKHDPITRKAGDPVGSKDIVPVKTSINVQVTCLGNYTGMSDRNYSVSEVDINSKKVKITVAPKMYTGDEITLDPSDISFVYNGEEMTNSHYRIDENSYKNNIKKGKASVVIYGNSSTFGGKKTVTFKIEGKKFRWWK